MVDLYKHITEGSFEQYIIFIAMLAIIYIWVKLIAIAIFRAYVNEVVIRIHNMYSQQLAIFDTSSVNEDDKKSLDET